MNMVEPNVKNWYEALEEGKIYGARCKTCGAFEFPPVPICNSCGHHDLEWEEIDGEGTLVAANTAPMPMFGPEYGIVTSGEVVLKEGVTFIGWILNLTDGQREQLFDKVPLKVHATTIQRDGYKYPAFTIDEGQLD